MAKWQASKSDVSPRKGYIPEIEIEADPYGCGAYNCLKCYPYQYSCDWCSEVFPKRIPNGSAYQCAECDYEAPAREDEDSHV